MRLIDETIRVKGQPDVALQVRVTRHGPLITDNRSMFQNTSETLAFRWTALDDQDRTLQALLGINRAGSWAEFTQALADYKTPMQNFVYADVDGNIGYYAPGALPIRAKGDGTLPVPGWTSEYEWSGYARFEDLPHIYNPPRGFIVSANNKAVPDSYPYSISSSWAPPYRAQRILELIESKPKLSSDDMTAMQADVRSAQARELLPYLLRAKTDDPRARVAIDLLRDWDGVISGASPQAAIYEAWYQRLPTRMFADELGDDLLDQYNYQAGFQASALARILKQDHNPWCDDTRTAPTEDCATIVGGALADGLAEMAPHQRSTDLASWRWDQAHVAIFPHDLLSQDLRLKPLFDRRIPNGGDAATINAAPVMNFDRYNQYFGPAYRQVIDLSNLGASKFMHPVGQSGQILSRNYSDLLERWQRVEYLPMRFDTQAIDAAEQGRLVLTP